MAMTAVPTISVVIPTRDRVDLLRRALASVARQDADVEVIVVDDGDGAGARVAQTAGLVPVTALVSGSAGQVGARNLGVAAAQGRWIAFLDDDDWWAEPTHLTRMLAAAASAPCLVHASGLIVVEGERADAGAMLSFQSDASRLRRDNRLLVSGVLYPRATHATLGPFDASLPYYWDWDWYLRLHAAGLRFIASDSTAVRISARGDSVSAEGNAAERGANLARLAAKHGLTGLVLRNHESIARDGNRPS